MMVAFTYRIREVSALCAMFLSFPTLKRAVFSSVTDHGRALKERTQ